jgi:hypothetical protein
MVVLIVALSGAGRRPLEHGHDGDLLAPHQGGEPEELPPRRPDRDNRVDRVFVRVLVEIALVARDRFVDLAPPIAAMLGVAAALWLCAPRDPSQALEEEKTGTASCPGHASQRAPALPHPRRPAVVGLSALSRTGWDVSTDPISLGDRPATWRRAQM